MAPRTFRNWNGSAFSTPSVVAEPANLHELIEVVRNRNRFPSPVRAAGSFHSLNGCFSTTGTQVLLKHFDDIRVDLEASTVTVGAAVTMIRMRDALRPFGMQTEVTPEIGNATAGSVACCGTKDASVRGSLAQVSSTVIAVKLVNAKGEVEECSDESDPERMRVIRSSYGLLGIVFEVTFRIQPTVLLHTTYASFRLNPPPTRAEMFGGADGMLGIALPYANRIVVERRWIRDGRRVSRFSSRKRRVRDRLWENGASRFATLLPYDWYYPVLDRLLVLPLSVLKLLGGFDGMRSDSTIEFRHERRHYFDFTFCAVPMSAWETFVPAYVRFGHDFRRETGFRVTLLSEVYVMSRDEHSLLSPTATEESFTMNVTDTRIDHRHWKEFNRRFNSLVADHGGRPLLNQTKELTRDVVHRMLGNDWRRFLAIREEEDLEGRFLNRYFRELM
jgi:hypothetical protein